jgi:hypothetical protein
VADAKIVFTAIDATKQAFESVKGNLTGLHTKAVAVTGALAAIGATAWAADLIAGVRSSINELDELGKAAQRTGFQSAQGLAEYEYAARLAGVATAGFETAVGKLSSKMADAAGGNKEAINLFDKLGVKVTDTSGKLRATEAVLDDLAERFASWHDGPEKSALALEIFSKSGKDLIPLLNGGKQGLEALRGEFRALRGQVTDENVKAAEQFNDNLTRLETSAGSLKRQLAEGLLPTLVQISDKMVDAAKKGGFWKGLIEADLEIMKRVTGIDLTSETRQLKARNDEIARLQGLLNTGKGGETQRAQLNLLLANPNAGRDAGYDSFESRRLADRASGGKTRAPVISKPDKDVQSAYKAINDELEKRLKLEQAELAFGGKLTEARKFEIEALAKIEASTAKLSATEKKRLQDQVAETKATIEKNELQDAEFKQAMEIAKERQRIKNEEYAAGKVHVEQHNDLVRQQLKTGKEMLEQIEFETSLLSMNTQEREVAIAMRELEKQGIKEGTLAWETYGQKIREATANKAQLEEQKEFWSSIEDAAKGTFTNILDGGTNLWKKLKDSAKAMFFDWLWQAAARPVMLQVGMAMGVPGAAQAAQVVGGGGMGNLAGGMLPSLLSGMSAPGGLLAGTALGGFGAGMGATLTNGLIGGFGANMSMIGSMVSGGSFGMALGAAMPYLAPLLLIGTLLSGKFKGEKRVGGQYSGTSLVDSPSGGAIGGAGDIIGSTIGSINSTLKALGSTSQLSTLVSGLEQSERGKGFAYAGGALRNADGSLGATFGQGLDGQGYMNRRGNMTSDQALAAFGEELKQATLQALQAANVPGMLGEYLRSLGDIDALDGGALDAALARINKALTEKQALEDRYFALTHTQGEQLAETRRREREALDESNRALLDTIHAREDELRVLGEKLTLEDQLYALTHTELEVLNLQRERERAALDESNRALYDQVAALQDQKRAAEEAAKAAELVAERFASINGRAAGLARDFLGEDEFKGFLVNQIQQRLASVGLNMTADEITGAKREDVQRMFEWFGQQGNMDAQEAILDVVDAFLELHPAAEDAAESIEDLAKQIQGLGRDIYLYVRDLKATRGGTASAQDLFTGTQKAYLEDLSLAKRNDVDALGRITGSAQAYIEAAKGYGASGSGTQAIIDQVIAELGALPATKSYEQQILLTLGQINSTLDLTQVNTLAKLEAMLTKSEVTQRTMAAILSRLSEDSILSYGKAEVSAIYGAIEANTRRTADILAAMGAVGGIPGTGAGSTPPPGAASPGDTTEPDTQTDAQRFDQELALYEQMRASAATTGQSIYQAAGAYGYDEAAVDAWLARTGLPAFARGGSHSGGWAMVGERGPELAFLPPARVYSNSDSRSMLDTSRMEAQIESLTQQVSALVRHEVAANGRKIGSLERVADGVDKLGAAASNQPAQPLGIVRA